MKILFAGTTAQAARVLRHLDTKSEIVAVLTREDAPFGRKGELQPSPVAIEAKQLGLKTIKANRVDPATNQLIVDSGAELGLVVAYGALLKAETLSLLPQGWFNLHFSLLPAYRGAAPVQHALLNGETETGISIFKLDEGMDTGDLFIQVPTTIEVTESAGDLLERLTTLGITALDELLPQLESGSAMGRVQQGLPSMAPKIVRKDARLDWTLQASAIENGVRAFNPEPMAWTEFAGSPVRVLSARATSANTSATPGTVASVESKVLVSCGHGSLELIEVQPAGKKPMSAIDWFRGIRGAVVLS